MCSGLRSSGAALSKARCRFCSGNCPRPGPLFRRRAPCATRPCSGASGALAEATACGLLACCAA
eukprot:4374661-Alexandrium_andersonii.AAC.1